MNLSFDGKQTLHWEVALCTYIILAMVNNVSLHVHAYIHMCRAFLEPVIIDDITGYKAPVRIWLVSGCQTDPGLGNGNTRDVGEHKVIS